ncbi:MAG: protein kinase [Bdellovibrionaceae bacterium]|nr:protein kinase [Pseudobdellovibrionaceae bacterium]
MKFKKFGKYTIIKKIASGGMADILLAAELSPTGFGHFIVIKRALSKFLDNEEFKDMFKNEGKVACNLKHKNITTIREFGIENNQFFLAMEYISGKNLRQFTKKIKSHNIKFSIPNIIYIIKEVAAGLNYAHNAIDANTGQPLNVIHRDVSPQNIMLTFDGQIKLIDFGIAKIDDTNLTRAGHLKGKFSYMSPEQATGQSLDGRSDIFCLGIIFWELLTNERLFASANELASLKKIRNCNIPNAMKINPNISSKLNDIVMKALSKNPASRYSTVAKMEQDLNLFLNKNYPEYSHYDFITFLKEIYRKDIMIEREKLKTYATEFKKHTNALNIENKDSTSIILDIPDIKEHSTNVKNLQANLTKSVTKTTNKIQTNKISDPTLFFQTQMTNQSETMSNDKSSTLIQKDLDLEKGQSQKYTLEEVNTTKKTQNKTNKIKTINSKLEVANKNQSSYSKTPLLSSLTAEQNKEIVAEKEQGSSYSILKALAFFGFFVLIISAFTKGVFWIIKEESKPQIITKDSSVNTVSPKQPISTTNSANVSETAQRKPTNDSKQIATVLISSSPSNANIYINNKNISKSTPTLLNLNLNSDTLITIKKKGFISQNIEIDKTSLERKMFIQLVRDESRKDRRIQIIQQ